MKKISYFILCFSIFCLVTIRVNAMTIRETTDSNDSYSTLDEGSIIIGVTKFMPDTVVTASRASIAGSNDAILYVLQNGSVDGYENPGLYYYVDPNVGWFVLDSNNKAIPVVDEDTLEELSKLDIYYVDNTEKVLEIEYNDNNIDVNNLPKGVEFRDNKLFINATLDKVEFKTTDQKKVSFVMDSITSSFIPDIRSCYMVSEGIITGYDSECGSEIVIPMEINNDVITGIGVDAFRNSNLISVIIPSNIKYIGNNAFAENKLEKVIIQDKYDKTDFILYGDNLFGEFDNIVYENEMTNVLNLFDDELVLEYYKDFDYESFVNNNSSEYGVRSYVVSYIMNRLEKNGYNYNYCGFGPCKFDKNMEEDSYGIGFESFDGKKYRFALQKYDSSSSKVYNYIKEFSVSFNEGGTKEDNSNVLEAINNLRMDERYYNGNDVVTRMKYLEDLEDIYDIDIILTTTRYGYGGYFPDEMKIYPSVRNVYYLKDNVLYQVQDKAIVYGLNNIYDYNDDDIKYENIDDYANVVLEDFLNKTGIKNYNIIKNKNDSIYSIGTSSYETAITYNINVIDIEYNEKWEIRFVDYYDDKYDEDGYTKAECFEFSSGVITDYDGTCGINVRIPNKINGEVVSEIGGYRSEFSYDDCSFCYIALNSVSLPNTIKKIRESAFAGNRLINIEIPDSVLEIGDFAFMGNRLTSVEIPDSVNYMGYAAFDENNIESVKLGSGLNKISEYLFANNKIKNISIPSNIETIDYYAFNNNQIEELIIPDDVKNIGQRAFSNNKINSLKLPTSLESIGSGAFTNNQLSDSEAFIYAKKFDNETNGYVWDDSTLVSYGGAKRDDIKIPSNVKIIADYAFMGLGLEEIEIPYGVEKLGYQSFTDNNLSYVTVPDTVREFDYFVFDGNKFKGDNSFIYARDKNGNVDYSSLVAYYNSEYNIDELVIPNGVKKIWPYAFSSVSINKLVVPYGVEEIGDYAFQMVTITNVFTLPKSITKMGVNVFAPYYNILEEDGYIYARDEDGNIDKSILMGFIGYSDDGVINIPEGVVEIGENAFNNNSNINEIIFPSTLRKINSGAFGDMCNLENVMFNDNLEVIGESAFEGYNNINSVTFGKNLKVIGDRAFYNNEISSIQFNDKLESIGNSAFAQNDISQIIIPSSVKTIGEYAFNENYNLSNITFSEGLKEIGNMAFYNGIYNNIVIPESVTSIGNNAFRYGMSRVDILGKSDENDFEYLGNNSFGDVFNIVYEIPKLELPQLSQSFNETVNIAHSTTNGVEYLVTTTRTYEITDIKYSFEIDRNTGLYDVKLLFSGSKTYYWHANDNDEQSFSIKYSLKDRYGNVVQTGSFDLPSVKVGETFVDVRLDIYNVPYDEKDLILYIYK